jgi:acyl-coenzyme A thioesterase PaaI-like protein
MKLALSRPSIASVWAQTSRLPLGRQLFSRFVGRMAPYTGTMGATVLELRDGLCRTELRDRRGVRNHLSSIHAVALVNLGELTTGLAVMHAVDGRGRGIVTRLDTEFLKKARGTLTAEARVEVPCEPGRHEVVVTGEVKDAAGDVVSRTRASWRIELR